VYPNQILRHKLGDFMELNPKYEQVIHDLLKHNYAVADGFFDASILIGLKKQLLMKMKADILEKSGVGNKAQLVKNQQIRTDKIKWIEQDSTNKFEQLFNQQINDFCQYLNRTCYTGIQNSEFHYACFEKGAFYKRHIDRFKNDNARKFSMVTYLNEDWIETDGGKLMIYTEERAIPVLPIWARTVIFKSDLLEHEVMIAEKDRLSVTGWLK
jgi:SM-20-related protein